VIEELKSTDISGCLLNEKPTPNQKSPNEILKTFVYAPTCLKCKSKRSDWLFFAVRSS
jgi:hypothetical protein